MSLSAAWNLVGLDSSTAEDGRPALVLEVDGVGEFELSHFTSTFRLNEIPRALCLLPTGRLARDPRGTRAAPIHEAMPLLRQLRKARVKARVTGDWEPGRKWAWDEAVVFEGYVTGPGQRLVDHKLHVSVHLVHWLADLTMSSTRSARQHPANPGNLFHPAVEDNRAPGAGSGFPSQPAYVSQLIGRATTADLVADDLTSAIKGILCRLAEEDVMFLDGCLGSLSPGPGETNLRARNALARIEGPGGGSAACGRDYRFACPLQMSGLANLFAAADSIAGVLTEASLASLAASTFWDALVQLILPEFQLLLVPMVSRALLVADAPLQTAAVVGNAAVPTVWRRLRTEDFGELDAGDTVARPLRGVGIYTGWRSETNYDGPFDPNRPGCIGGIYDSGATDGVWLFKQAPAWLASLPDSARSAGDVNGISQRGGPTPPQVLYGSREFFDRYAQAEFVANHLRGRTASLRGKLRWDVAPGSLVQVANRGEQFLDASGLDQLAVPLYAQVTGVSHVVSAESQFASTSLELAHVRYEHELSDPRMVFDGHPLFSKPLFVGAPLVDEWDFGNAKSCQ